MCRNMAEIPLPSQEVEVFPTMITNQYKSSEQNRSTSTIALGLPSLSFHPFGHPWAYYYHSTVLPMPRSSSSENIPTIYPSSVIL